MSKQNWFKMQLDAENENSISIDIFGEIGGDGTTAQDFKNELDKYSNYDTINLSLFSGGGSVFEGYAIYNLLISNKAHLKVIINSFVASISSVIAMAGDEIEMFDNSKLIIHEPYTLTIGDEKEHKKSAEMLSHIRNDIVKIYQTKFNKSEQEIKDIIAKETWFTASQLNELGVINKILEGGSFTAELDIKNFKNSFDLTNFKNIPDDFKNLLKEADEVEAIAETEVEAVAEKVDETDENLDEVETEVENKTEIEDVTIHSVQVKEIKDENGKIVEFQTYGETSTTSNIIEMKLELDSLNLKLEKATESNTKLTEQVSTLTADKEKLFNDSIEIQARLDQLLSPAMKKENTVQSFKEAIDKAGSYVEARKQYPEVFEAYKQQINNK